MTDTEETVETAPGIDMFPVGNHEQTARGLFCGMDGRPSQERILSGVQRDVTNPRVLAESIDHLNKLRIVQQRQKDEQEP